MPASEVWRWFNHLPGGLRETIYRIAAGETRPRCTHMPLRRGVPVHALDGDRKALADLQCD